MAAHDETIRLILEMTGDQSVAALNKLLVTQKTELKELEQAWKMGLATSAEYAAAQNMVQAEIYQTNAALMQLKGTGAGGAGGQGVMAMSYAFQDFTSQIRNGIGPALASIQNNIPGMLVGSGLSNPMIAAISAISVALGLIAPQIVKAFGVESQEELEKAKEKLKEFEEQVKKTHEEFKKMSEKPTSEEEEYIANLKAIFEGKGNAAVIKQAIMGALAPAGPVGMTDAEIRAGAAQRAGEHFRPGDELFLTMEKRIIDELTGQRAVLRAQEAEQRGTAAETLMGQALTAGPLGEKARERIAGVQFPEQHLGLVREMAGVMPEVMERADKRDREHDEGLERAREAGVRRKKIRQNDREGFEEAKRFHQQLDAEKEQHDEHVDEALEAGLKDLDRIGRTVKRRRVVAGIQGMRRQQQFAGQQEAQQAQDLATQASRTAQDVEYWTKYNSGMADASVQMARASELLHRNAQDTATRVQRAAAAMQNMADRNMQGVAGGGMPN